ncbi:MAG: Mfa1 fimbrilin C-terminal domain-containing protein [Muribaculaceae bacterium]|nr:Mfa1 fimbrilin C-terminal domain-containing protein [Muribaculaceae bacterium]
MKKGLFLSGAIGLMALGLASCSSDEPAGFVDEKVTADETRYLSVSLCSPTNYMSRAGEFEDGTAQESAINYMMFVFYDGSGAPTGQSVRFSRAQASTGWSDDAVNANITKFWTSVVPVEMTQGQNKPVYVMCFINPLDMSKLDTMTLDEIDKLERESISSTVDGNTYFAMSNSVYYGQNPITGQSNVRVMATPIVDGQLYATEADAQAAANAQNCLEIYVERYAAKIGLSMAPNVIQEYNVKIAGATPDAALTDGSLTFTPAYWRPNAVDFTTFVTKGFNTDPEGANVGAPATFAEMNTAFQNTGMVGQGLTGWNDAANFRSYWACSPSYYANAYPTVSDDITDVTDEGGEYPYEVQYFTYNQLASPEDGTPAPIAWNATTGFAKENSFYSRETTASLTKLTDKGTNNKAVPAAVNIIGNYRRNGVTTNTTFYLYGKSDGLDVYYDDTNIEQAMIANQHVIFTNQQGTTYATSTDKYIIQHPSKEVRGDQKVAGRLVTLQINPENMTGLYFWDGNNFVAINEENIVAANQLLWASASTAQKFHEGLAYFAVPIRHLGWGVNVPGDKPLTIEGSGDNGRGLSINWPNLRRGDLGVVRNHVYSIEVTGVTGLGIGLENPDQPMVPPMDPDNYYVAARLNVLAWRVVPTATVTL